MIWNLLAQNAQCACLLGVDIGAYDTCGYLCRYCFANTNVTLVKENMRKHDPSSPFLLGVNMPWDIIHKAEQKSWIDGQKEGDFMHREEIFNKKDYDSLLKEVETNSPYKRLPE